ncbi:MAG: O-antigen ligase family protein [Clostridia bacterium]|nr:O-antigen ligase family protein [Clostridia bacterium]
MEYIFKSEKSVKTIEEIRKFLLSDRWMLILFSITMIISCLHSHLPKEDFHIWGTVVLAYITGICFLFTGDIMAMLTPTLFTYIIAMRCYNSFEAFKNLAGLIIPLIFMLLFNLIVYGKKPSAKGYLFLPMLFVSVAVTLGGVGVIPAKEYFAGVSLFNMLGIGFGMLLIYCLFYPRINTNDDYSLIEKLTKIMVVVGLTASFMIFAHYIININDVIDRSGIIYMRWRNNTSTILMITMPFAFFMANKKSYSTIIGFIFYLAMLLTGSRGGMVFGTIELIMCIVMFVLYDRRRRLAYAIICVCFVVVALIFLPEITQFLNYTLKRLFRVLNEFLLGGKDTETRVRHYARGIKDYLNNPVFGIGLGNMANRDIFQNKPGALCWYHCEPIQIAGSFGTVGIIAFVYQFIKRNILIWKKATLFNMTVFLSYISLELMSLVNPGILCPVPYLLLVTIFLIIVEKCDDGEVQEKIPILKKFRDARKQKLKEKKEKALITK